MTAEGRDETVRDDRDEETRDESHGQAGVSTLFLPWAPNMPTAIREILADAIDIADSSARADVECNCPWTYLKEADDTSSRWYDTDRIDPEDAAHLEQALRYLGARGRLNVHPTRPELVNFVGVA